VLTLALAFIKNLLIKYQTSFLLRLKEHFVPAHQAPSGCTVLSTVKKHNVCLSYRPHLSEAMSHLFLLPLAATLATGCPSMAGRITPVSTPLSNNGSDYV